MTENNHETANEVATDDKVENTVQIAIASKEKVDAMEKLRRRVNSKKTVTTRSVNKLETSIQVFRESAAKNEADKTLATKILLKESAKEVIENRDKVKEYRKDLEKLTYQLKEALNECEPTETQKGATLEDAMKK